MTNAANKTTTAFHMHVSEGQVRVMVWTRGEADGVTANFRLTDAEVRRFSDELLATAEKLPRIGTPADLGCEAL